jgi:hypothetical protein
LVVAYRGCYCRRLQRFTVRIEITLIMVLVKPVTVVHWHRKGLASEHNDEIGISVIERLRRA